MSKGSRRSRETRWLAQPLGHTVSRRRPWDPIPTVRSTLMRTVLGDTTDYRGSPNTRPNMLRVRSPVVAVRATGRSSDRQVRSPFLNATMVTPQLTARSLICARRSIRREVLFATKRTNGSGAKKTRSKVGC